jgi:N-methylhydantoinase A
MQLDDSAARRAVGTLAERLGLPLEEAAEGILAIVNSNMANAIRSRTVQKGIDPRDYSLAAFGGAGPLHGAEVAALLGIPEVIVPPHPGITSAVGLLTTDMKFDMLRTVFQAGGDIDPSRLSGLFEDMRQALTERFAAARVAPESVTFARFADARYVGQGYELRVPVAAGAIDRASIADSVEQFHRRHEAEYGHAFRSSPVEIVNIRLTGVAETPKIGRPSIPRSGTLGEAQVAERPTSFRVGDGELRSFDTVFYRRDALPVGQRFNGPAVILQIDSTTVVPPEWSAEADPHGNLVLRAGTPS